MTNAQHGDPSIRRGTLMLILLTAAGVLMVVTGVLGGFAAIANAMSASWGTSSANATLSVRQDTRYLFPGHTNGPDVTGFWIGAVIAVLGAAVLVVAIFVAVTRRRAQRGAPRWSRLASMLLGAGVVMTVVGLVGGLVARWTADITALASSSATRLLTQPSETINAQLELTFDPSSAHPVAPNYTLFWVFMLVAALGVVAVVAAVVAAIRRARVPRPVQS